MKALIVSQVISGMAIGQKQLTEFALFALQLKTFLLASRIEVEIADEIEKIPALLKGPAKPEAIIFISRAMKTTALKIIGEFSDIKTVIFAGNLEGLVKKGDRIFYLNKYIEDPFSPLLKYLQK
jgi:hypothetical protein